MDVKKLVLPAAEEAELIWTKKLGFKKMSNERVSVLYKDKSFIPISVYSRNYCMLFRVHYPDIDSDNMKGMNSLQIQI